MRPAKSRLRRTLLLVPVLGLALAAAGCETLESLNPFAEREKPLPGARSPVFPEGVPGVDYNQAPPAAGQLDLRHAVGRADAVQPRPRGRDRRPGPVARAARMRPNWRRHAR